MTAPHHRCPLCGNDPRAARDPEPTLPLRLNSQKRTPTTKLRGESLTNSDVVRAFIEAAEAKSLDGMLECMTPDVRYINVGMTDVTGHDAIRPQWAPLIAASTAIRWTLHNIAETPAGVVLTERADEFDMGGRTLSIPVMGVFEFKDGKISALRDHF
jgi:limonene-1,2-epoxide hydrolase